MSYFLTDDQEQIRDLARKFSRKEVEPLGNQIDLEEHTPIELTQKAAELGLFGLVIPEQYGGAGESLTTACIVLEEIAKASPSFAGVLSIEMILCPWVILSKGTEEQKQRLLPRSISGEGLMAYSVSEPAGALNAPAHLTRLTADGSNWRLNGAKLFCTQGHATTYIVSAKTNVDGIPGSGYALVERGAEGFSIAPYEDKLGWRGTNTGSLSFTDVLITPENILGDMRGGTETDVNNASFIAHCATALGCVEGMFDKTLAYVKERSLYGQPMHMLSPISNNLADVFNKIEAMRSLIYTSTRLYEAGRKELPMGTICKSFVCETAFACTNTLLQMWGGSGIMNSTGINRYFRDARAKMIAEAPTEAHNAIVAEFVLGLKRTVGGLTYG